MLFEQNGPPAWRRAQAQVEAFLDSLDRQGAFAGAEPDESYFVICDERVNEPRTVAEGKVEGAVRLRHHQALRLSCLARHAPGRREPLPPGLTEPLCDRARTPRVGDRDRRAAWHLTERVNPRALRSDMPGGARHSSRRGRNLRRRRAARGPPGARPAGGSGAENRAREIEITMAPHPWRRRAHRISERHASTRRAGPAIARRRCHRHSRAGDASRPTRSRCVAVEAGAPLMCRSCRSASTLARHVDRARPRRRAHSLRCLFTRTGERALGTQDRGARRGRAQ